MAMKSIRAIAALALVLFILTLTAVAIKTRGAIFVDAAIEIGNYGAEWPEAVVIAQDESMVSKEKGTRIQSGAHIRDELGLRYGFHRTTYPTLVHRIAASQHKVYKNIFEITLQGSDMESTVRYGEEINEWLISRHSRLFLASEFQRKGRYEEIRTRRQQIASACEGIKDRDISPSILPKEKWVCNAVEYYELALLELEVLFDNVMIVAKPSNVILRPTVRQ